MACRHVHEGDDYNRQSPQNRNGICLCWSQLARLDHQEAAGKALYALSNLLHNEKFRRRFFEEGGLALLQRLLAAQDTPKNVHRKALALLADLAHYQVSCQTNSTVTLISINLTVSNSCWASCSLWSVDANNIAINTTGC